MSKKNDFKVGDKVLVMSEQAIDSIYSHLKQAEKTHGDNC